MTNIDQKFNIDTNAVQIILDEVKEMYGDEIYDITKKLCFGVVVNKLHHFAVMSLKQIEEFYKTRVHPFYAFAIANDRFVIPIANDGTIFYMNDKDKLNFQKCFAVLFEYAKVLIYKMEIPEVYKVVKIHRGKYTGLFEVVDMNCYSMDNFNSILPESKEELFNDLIKLIEKAKNCAYDYISYEMNKYNNDTLECIEEYIKGDILPTDSELLNYENIDVSYNYLFEHMQEFLEITNFAFIQEF